MGGVLRADQRYGVGGDGGRTMLRLAGAVDGPGSKSDPASRLGAAPDKLSFRASAAQPDSVTFASTFERAIGLARAMINWVRTGMRILLPEPSSFIAECFNWIQPGGFAGRVKSEEYPDH